MRFIFAAMQVAIIVMTPQVHGQNVLDAARAFQAHESGRFVPAPGRPLDRYSQSLEHGSQQLAEQVQTRLMPALHALDVAEDEEARYQASLRITSAVTMLKKTLAQLPADEWNEGGWISYIEASLNAIEKGLK